jgi:hypothetical protein
MDVWGSGVHIALDASGSELLWTGCGGVYLAVTLQVTLLPLCMVTGYQRFFTNQQFRTGYQTHQTEPSESFLPQAKQPAEARLKL